MHYSRQAHAQPAFNPERAAINTLKIIGNRILQFALEPFAFTAMTRSQGGFLGVLFLLGIAHWCLFMQAGELFFNSGDWAKEYKYFAVLQEAVQTGRMPYHVSVPLSLMSTQRFMAIPETLSLFWPPTLLLIFLNVKQFILANTLILYSVGFAGCLLIRNRYRLSPFIFLLLFTLFNFNGYITAHLAAGHSMWVGYFFLPMIAYFLLKILEQQDGWAASGWLAASLFGMLLQGAFHMFIWCLMFLGLALIGTRGFRPRAQILTAILLGMLLSVLRLWPALLLGNVSRGVESGYNSWRLFLNALIRIQPWDLQIRPGIFFWEYDFYISAAGLFFIVVFGLGFRFYRDRRLAEVRYPGLDLALLGMLILSAGNSYQWLAAHIPVRLLALERVPTRFLVIPFIFLLIPACIRAQKTIQSICRKPALAWLALAAAGALMIMLACHSYRWRAAIVKPFNDQQLSAPLIVTLPDALYINRLHVAMAVSLVTGMVLTVIWLVRMKSGREGRN
ncbi:MAG: hypothetical protein WCL16_09000 [bacterium]